MTAPSLRQGSSHKPELIVTAKNDHNVIALGDAVLCEVISGFVGPLLHVRESEDVLFSSGIAPYHSTTVRIVYRDVINDVVPEIEVCRDVYFEVAKHTFTMVCLFDIPFMQVSHIVFLTEGIGLSSVVRRLRRRHAAAWGLPRESIAQRLDDLTTVRADDDCNRMRAAHRQSAIIPVSTSGMV